MWISDWLALELQCWKGKPSVPWRIVMFRALEFRKPRCPFAMTPQILLFAKPTAIVDFLVAKPTAIVDFLVAKPTAIVEFLVA